MAGLLVALAGILLSDPASTPVLNGIESLVIGLVLVAAAIFCVSPFSLAKMY
jgi:hypothetical protein